MKDIDAYREYAKKLWGDKAELLNRVEALERASIRALKAVADCGSDEDAARLFAGARLLGVDGQDKEALDSILALWELVRPAPGAQEGADG